jgi:hypothetical protein
VTGLTILARRLLWSCSYHAHLAALAVLDTVRYLLTAATLLTHRAHTAVAEHGGTVADVLDDGRAWADRAEFDRAKYLRLVDQLLNGIDLKENP